MKRTIEAVKMNNTIVEKLNNQRINNVLNNRVEDSYDVISYLKSNKNMEIEIYKASNAIRTSARLGYVAGSNIGLIVKLSFVYTVLMDNNYNKAFLKADGTVDMWLLRKVFQNVGKIPQVYGYDKIYDEEKANMIPVCNLQGRQMILLMSLKSDVETFATNLEKAETLVQEDLVNIGKDLEKISRLLSELDLDSAKDATIKEGLKDITDFINSFTCKLSSEVIKAKDNFDKIIADKKAGRPIGKLELTLEDYISMDDVYKIAAKEFENFKISNPDATEEELKKARLSIHNTVRDESYIEDPISLVKRNMIVNQEAFLNQIVDLYKQSDMSIFEDFKQINLNISEEIIRKIQHATVVAIDMINAHFAYRKDISMNKVDDLAKQLRNMIYTHGAKLGVEPADTFEIAMSAGWLYRGKNGNLSPVASPYKFKFAAINALFENELKWYLNPEVMYQSIDIELPENYSVALEQKIPMIDGECEVVLENGEIDYIICTKEMDFTGTVMAMLNKDNEVIFVKNVNEYEYEEVDFILFDEICDMTLPTNVYTHGDVIGQAAATKPLIEEPTYNLPEAEASLNHAVNVEKFKLAFTMFNNMFRLPLVDKSYSHGLVKSSTDKRYLTITKGDKSRMAARILFNNKNKKASDYASIDIMACNKGALIIFK